MWLFVVPVLTLLTTHGSAVALPVCAVDQFQCSNGDCISELWRCDGETDCEIGEDEFGCNPPSCDPNQFRCHTGQCVPMFWRCDGTRDCFDGTDEKDCNQFSRCKTIDFKCEDGNGCLDESLRCNGKKDCEDGSDEKNCTTSDSCTNSTCSQLCENTPLGPQCSCHDGYILDTKDNETCSDVDECQMDGFCSQSCSNFPGGYNCSCLEGYQLVNGTKCQAEDTYCSGEDFKCRNGRCILKSRHCDRRDDCGDNSDEENCLVPLVCAVDQFQCSNGDCISELWRCDGETDCVDGEDESECNATRCNPNQFRCYSGQCVLMSWRCDGASDCFDGTDEEDCNQFYPCKAIDFKCEDGSGCFDESLRCNGKKDCEDGSDEKNCRKSTVANCKDGMFSCSDGTCLYDYEVCDGHEDCMEKEDESNCTRIACESFEMMCPGGRCIRKNWICDGDKDCSDGSDEKNCTRYSSTTEAPRIQPPPPFCDGFFCYETGNCLTWSMVCDGQQDCTEMPDEGGECHSSCSSPFNGGCTQNCQSTPQGPKCFCFKGYRLLPDNKTCSDIDECMIPGFCSHFCSNTNGSFECSCATGYFLHNSRECKADGGPASLVYLLDNQIQSIDLVSYSERAYLNLADADIRSMDYDATDGLFYLTEWTDGTINTYSPDTQRMDVIVKPSLKPQNVKYDWIVGNLYYSDGDGNIGACSKDGRFCSTILELGDGSLHSFDISPTTGLLFWITKPSLFHNRQTRIVIRAEMDGSARLGIISSQVLWPTSLTIDHILSTIYWFDTKLNVLECADFQGLKRRQVVISGMHLPFSMSIFEDDVYWADWGISIRRCNKFTGIDCTTVKVGGMKTMEILFVYKAVQPKGVNKCLNSSCPHLCLPTRSNFVCKCADGFMQVYDTCQPLVPVHPQPDLSCPRDYCLGGGQCTVENGTFTCKCTEYYTGKKCEIEIPAVSKGKEYNFYSWIVERLDYNRTEKQEPVPEDGKENEH